MSGCHHRKLACLLDLELAKLEDITAHALGDRLEDADHQEKAKFVGYA